MTLAELQNRAGQAEVAVSAFEREHGHPRPGTALFVRYNDLLRAAAEAKGDLRCEMARVTGVYEHTLFKPTK